MCLGVQVYLSLQGQKAETLTLHNSNILLCSTKESFEFIYITRSDMWWDAAILLTINKWQQYGHLESIYFQIAVLMFSYILTMEELTFMLESMV